METLTSLTYYSIIHEYEEIKRRSHSLQNKNYKVNSNKKICIFQVYLVVSAFVFGIAIAWLLYPGLMKSFIKFELTGANADTMTAAPNMTSQQEEQITGHDNNNIACIDLLKTKNWIKCFESSRRCCFNISRSGRYSFNLVARVKCSSNPSSQSFSIMLRNKTLEHPAILSKQTLCTGNNSHILIQKTFEAQKYSQILMESTTSLMVYLGSYLKLE